MPAKRIAKKTAAREVQPDAPTDAPLQERKLGDTYRHAGYTYHKMDREGDVAMYAAVRPGESAPFAYEVFIVQHNPGGSIARKNPKPDESPYSVIAPGENPPAGSKWGILGWTFMACELDRARARYQALLIEKGVRKSVPVRSRRPA